MRTHQLLLLAAALSLTACAPRALFFHESTKVAFAATYNTSDTQPLATSFGFKRRIVAVVPAQERVIPADGGGRHGTNRGEALSLVSKFNVRAGTNEGVVITTSFASGMAARTMTRSGQADAAVGVLMHSAPIEVSTVTGETDTGQTGADAVNARIARIMGKRTRPSDVPPSRRKVDLDESGNLRGGGSGGAGKKPDEPALPGGPRKDDVPASGRTVDLDENENIKGTGPKKDTVPASTRKVDLSPGGDAAIRKK